MVSRRCRGDTRGVCALLVSIELYLIVWRMPQRGDVISYMQASLAMRASVTVGGKIWRQILSAALLVV
jgi:hypothetical protein